MKNLLVLGIGSPFGDDQLGWKVIDALPNLPTSVQKKKLDRPGLSILSEFQGVSTVIIVDAMVGNQAKGHIHRLTKADIIAHQAKNLSSHSIAIPDALKLGDTLNILPNEIILFGMEIDPNYSADDLSEHVKNSLQRFVEIIFQEISAHV